jgi:hypothetical protein
MAYLQRPPHYLGLVQVLYREGRHGGVEDNAEGVEEGGAVLCPCTWMSATCISMLQFIKIHWYELTITTTTATVTKPVTNTVPPAPSIMPTANPGCAATTVEKLRIQSIYDIVNLVMGIWRRKRKGTTGIIYDRIILIGEFLEVEGGVIFPC